MEKMEKTVKIEKLVLPGVNCRLREGHPPSVENDEINN